MIVKEIQDKYNENKVWVIKSYPCGHYYLNKKNGEFLLNKRFIKVAKRFLVDLGLPVGITKQNGGVDGD